eukprot:jgi/Phyca11/11417/fgenesh1_pm.PHYCAscaffold_70_\
MAMALEALTPRVPAIFSRCRRCLDLLVSCSIHEVHEKVTGCKVTERMFADGKASERASIRVNATLRPLGDHEVQDTITVRRLSDYFDFGVVLATWNFTNDSNAEGEVEGKFYLMENAQTLQVNATFYPREGGLQTALLVPCWKQKSAAFGYPVSADEFVAYPMVDPLVHVDAEIAFKNPYGYLPGLLYGLFPFK